MINRLNIEKDLVVVARVHVVVVITLSCQRGSFPRRLLEICITLQTVCNYYWHTAKRVIVIFSVT